MGRLRLGLIVKQLQVDVTTTGRLVIDGQSPKRHNNVILDTSEFNLKRVVPNCVVRALVGQRANAINTGCARQVFNTIGRGSIEKVDQLIPQE